MRRYSKQNYYIFTYKAILYLQIIKNKLIY